ncbi:MAG: carbon-nitrogen hydrolase family protein [Pseudomonadota bacterium]
MARLRVGFVEWPEGLTGGGAHWDGIGAAVAASRPDLLVTNELPFGPWLADSPDFSEAEAERSIRAHGDGLESLIALGVPAILSSRPVRHGDRLANEAFVLEGGRVRPLHRKQVFPGEPGWFESAWYAGDGSGFAVADILGIGVGVLLCTEAMFNEQARFYGRQGASLIVIPRASGVDRAPWRTAGAMAALVSGAYVASSNRVGLSGGGTRFGGGGFACAPGGRLIGETGAGHSLVSFDLDPAEAAAAQRGYPCYVGEIGGSA